jgi:hypothetical protein
VVPSKDKRFYLKVRAFWTVGIDTPNLLLQIRGVLHDDRDISCFSGEIFLFPHFTNLKDDLKLAFKLSIR